MAAVAQRSMPLQPGAPQLCAARPDPFQQALIVCPPGFQGNHVNVSMGKPQNITENYLFQGFKKETKIFLSHLNLSGQRKSEQKWKEVVLKWWFHILTTLASCENLLTLWIKCNQLIFTIFNDLNRRMKTSESNTSEVIQDYLSTSGSWSRTINTQRLSSGLVKSRT